MNHSQKVQRANGNPLGPNWYRKPTVELAKQLLGMTLQRRLPSGDLSRSTIVEVEAYLPKGDSASHSWKGQGNKNASMFAKPGTLYVYPIHGRHCLNVVTEPATVGAAVLVRAVEPQNAQTQLWQARHRETQPASWAWRDLFSLTRGPGRLCEALSVDRELDGTDLTTGQQIWLSASVAEVLHKDWNVCRSCRINVTSAKALRLRWFIDGNRFVSGPTREHRRGRNWTFFDLP